MAKEVGVLSERVVFLLGISLQPGQSIYLGPSNIAHMQARHPADYERYGQYIEEILSFPDYVGENPTDGSIEYVKEFLINGGICEGGCPSVRRRGAVCQISVCLES